MIKQPLNSSFFRMICILSCISLTIGCEPSVPSDSSDLPNIEVNPEFEQAPVIPEDMAITRISEDQVLLTAQFSDSARERIGEPYLKIRHDEGTFTFRDDGKGGDENADDGIFSVIIKISENQLSEEFERFNRKLETISRDSLFDFENRVRKEFIPRELPPRFDFSDFEIRKTFDLAGIFKLKLFPPVNLKSHSLVITDTKVVEDPTRTFNPCTKAGNPIGVWTFGKAMEGLANTPMTGVSVTDFTMNWLNTWATPHAPNGDVIDPRAGIISTIIDPWLAKSGGVTLDMSMAPFKLIAIVNRLDLRGNSSYGVSDAGEGRLVFAAMNSNCNTLPFTVIFEYGINKKTCFSLKAFAQQWYDLKDLSLGSPAYNAQLQAITDQFVPANTNPSKANGSSLNQLRTNEIALASPWELREWVIDAGSHQLEPTTVKMEPDAVFNLINTGTATTPVHIQRLATWVNANSVSIENNNYTVPEILPPSTHFLGGHSLTTAPPFGHFWDAAPFPGLNSITSDKARHIFSLNTCSGCHGGETNTPFLHIGPPPGFGSAASLSGFLTGIMVTDPAGRPSGSPDVRHFNDLQRRAFDLHDFVNQPCISIFSPFEVMFFDPLRMVH